MSPNLYLIEQRSAEIRLILRQLEQVRRVEFPTFSTNDLLVDATLYRLLRAIEAAQAICTHLAARLPTRAPISSPDCFLALSESGVLSRELAGRLQLLARFRNLLVHRYWELDLEQVYRIVGSDSSDLETYLREVEAFLR